MKLPAYPNTLLTQTWDSGPVHSLSHITFLALSTSVSLCVFAHAREHVFQEDDNYYSKSLQTLEVPIIQGSYFCHLQSRTVKSPTPQSLGTHPLQG